MLNPAIDYLYYFITPIDIYIDHRHAHTSLYYFT